jgi:hypothetical protein
MCKSRRWSRWVLVGAIILFPASLAIAQQGDNPFSGLGVEGEAAAVDPAAAAVESPAKEKSIVAAEGAEEGRTHTHSIDQDFCRCVGESDSKAVARIEKVLQSPLGSTGVDFADAPLEEVISSLQEDYGIPIQIDEPALEATGLDPTEQVTANLHNITLASALRLMLKRLNLVYIINDEVLLITTPEEADANLSTCVYNVREFVDDTSDRSMEELMDTIVSCVTTDSWAENGNGEAEIRSLRPGLLVISQTQDVHAEINSLLKAIHDMRGGADAGNAAGWGAKEVVTRQYVLQVDGDAEKLGGQVRELIIQSLPEVQWDGQLPDGQSVMLTVLGNRVIVRQTQPVQEKVAAVLKDSGVAAPARPNETHRRHGGRSPRDGNLSQVGGGGGGGGFFSPVSHPPRIDE